MYEKPSQKIKTNECCKPNFCYCSVDGPTGPTGPTGAIGATEPTGATGATGQQGEPDGMLNFADFYALMPLTMLQL